MAATTDDMAVSKQAQLKLVDIVFFRLTTPATHFHSSVRSFICYVGPSMKRIFCA